MVNKIIAVMMWALIAHPFCCCLSASEQVESSTAVASCCASEVEKAQEQPVPCDCESHESESFLLTENLSLMQAEWKMDLTDLIGAYPSVSEFDSLGCELIPVVPDSMAFYPSSRRFFQEYCVYLL